MKHLSKRFIKKIKTLSEKTPVYPAWKCGEKSVRIFCPYCCDYHDHGVAGLEKGDVGHRSAHCNHKPTEHQHGYYIFLADLNDV